MVVVYGARPQRSPGRKAPLRGHHSQIPVSERISMATPTQPTTARPEYSGIVRFSWKRCSQPNSEERIIDDVQHARGRRIEIDVEETRWTALGWRRAARHHDDRPAIRCGKPDPRDTHALRQHLRGIRQVRRQRLRHLRTRHRIAAGIDHGVEFDRARPARRPKPQSAQVKPPARCRSSDAKTREPTGRAAMPLRTLRGTDGRETTPISGDLADALALNTEKSGGDQYIREDLLV